MLRCTCTTSIKQCGACMQWGSKTIKQLGEIAKGNEKMKSQPLKKHVADLKKQLMQIKKDITALEKLFANLEKDL